MLSFVSEQERDAAVQQELHFLGGTRFVVRKYGDRGGAGRDDGRWKRINPFGPRTQAAIASREATKKSDLIPSLYVPRKRSIGQISSANAAATITSRHVAFVLDKFSQPSFHLVDTKLSCSRGV